MGNLCCSLPSSFKLLNKGTQVSAANLGMFKAKILRQAGREGGRILPRQFQTFFSTFAVGVSRDSMFDHSTSKIQQTSTASGWCHARDLRLQRVCSPVPSCSSSPNQTNFQQSKDASEGIVQLTESRTMPSYAIDVHKKLVSCIIPKN